MAIQNWKKLIRACQKGDRKSQKVLYDHFKGKMFALCLRYADSNVEAEDMLLEGFYKVFRDLHQFTPGNSLEGWVRQVMIRTALMVLRKKKKIVEVHPEYDALSTALEDRETIITDIYAREILEQIQRLPTGYRVIFNLFAIEGYSHREIAEQLNISENTSKSQYLRARAALKKRLNSQKVI